MASWLAQRQSEGGASWAGRLSTTSPGGFGTGRAGGAMTEPLLASGAAEGSQNVPRNNLQNNGSRNDPRNSFARNDFSGIGCSGNDPGRGPRPADDPYGESMETGFGRRRCVIKGPHHIFHEKNIYPK